MRIFLSIAYIFIHVSVYCQEKIANSGITTAYSYQYALIEASRQKMIGNVNEAIGLYLSCIKSNPKSDVAHYELGTVFSAIGENTKAEESLGIAYNLNPENYWYGIAYSELLKHNNKSSKSLKILKKTRKLNETNQLTIDFKIAEIYAEQKKYKKAINFLEEIESENGLSEMISFKKFEVYKLQKNYDDAIKVIMDLINEAPEIAEYQIILAEFYNEIGDSVNALISYENAFKIDSSNIFAVSNLADMYSALGDDSKAYYYLNRAILNRNIPVSSKIQTLMMLNKDRALIKKNRVFIEEMVKNLLIEYPGNIDVLTVAYDFYNGLDEHDKALALIKEILEKKKDDYIIWQQALYNSSMIENYDQLIQIGEEALKYFPNKNEVYLFVGMAYFQKQKFEEAYNILSGAYSNINEKDKIRVQFLLFVSEAAYKTDRKKEAYSYFDQLIIEDPSNDFTKNNYSYYLSLDSIDLLKAKELSYSTIVNSPENSTFIDTYAWILFKLGDYGNAKSYSQKALIINGESDPDIIFHYAEILYALRDFELARKYYKLALEHGYDKEIIEKRMQLFSKNF